MLWTSEVQTLICGRKEAERKQCTTAKGEETSKNHSMQKKEEHLGMFATEIDMCARTAGKKKCATEGVCFVL
jgi:hypothetical protein